MSRKVQKMEQAYEEAVAYLYEMPKFTKKNGLEHTKEVIKRLQIAENRFKIIHVAGSNGKGSVCSALSQVLVQNGKRTGMFISPHLVKMEERFCIDGEPCSRRQFLDAFHEVGTVVEDMRKDGKAHPTFFEYLFAMGMLIFAKEEVEYLILETGLGGRLDCTNIFAHPIATVITSISLEHTEYLGDTIPEIAGEKSGIIKEGVPVIYDASTKEAAEVIEGMAKKRHAPCYGVLPKSLNFHEIHGKCIDFYFRCDYDEDTKISIPFTAPYQMMNMALAYRTMRLLEPVTGIAKEEILKAVSQTRWQGRMQEVKEEIFLDGAHNVAGILAFLDSVALMGVKKPLLLFSMVADKDYEEAIRLLAERVDWEQIFVTEVPDERGIPAGELAEVFARYGRRAVPIESCEEAYLKAEERKQRGQILFCTGSLYFMGELLYIIGGKKDD